MTIKDSQGHDCYLSEDTYEVIGVEEQGHYKNGTHVRLIGGVDEKYDHPGYHFYPEYRTVCRIDAPIAEFYGLRRSQLRKLSTQKEQRL